MNRKRLSRIAFAVASDRLLADMQAGKITRNAAATKLAALKAAKNKRDEQISFGAFIASNGLGSVLSHGAR